jgi:hypothetical protein
MTATRTRAGGWRRRELLAGLGGIGLLPLISGGSARAQAASPRRLVVFYTPNGTIGPQWRPGGGESDFTLGRILTPLAPWRSKLLVLGGVDMALAEAGFGSHHTRGMGGLLTGRPILMGSFRSAGPPTAGWASGISIDQHIARQLATTAGGSTRFRTLELGVRVVDAEVRGRISYLGPNQPVPPMESPYDVFDRIFAGGRPPTATPGGDASGERLRLQRKSVLDFLGQELNALRGRVGAEDRARIDAHLESVRDIERRLQPAVNPGSAAPAPAPLTCATPTLAPRIDLQADESLPAIGRLHMDLLAGALACDQVRVATLQWTHAESNHTFPFLGVNGQHHAMSHAGDGDAAAQESLSKINVFYAEQLRYLLDRLASYREGDRTLLDNTVVLWAIEVGKGNNHAHRDLPFLLAGSCGGHFRTGRFVDYLARGRSQPHNNLLVSLANAMGLPDQTFGDPAHCTGSLPDLATG